MNVSGTLLVCFVGCLGYCGPFMPFMIILGFFVFGLKVFKQRFLQIKGGFFLCIVCFGGEPLLCTLYLLLLLMK